jgi:hypothetical protein
MLYTYICNGVLSGTGAKHVVEPQLSVVDALTHALADSECVARATHSLSVSAYVNASTTR